MPSTISVTRADIRRMAVEKQCLLQRPATASADTLAQIIRRIGLLQLDSIAVVARSHYLVILARAGLYEQRRLDGLLDSGELFETWAHAACQVPIADYPFFHANILHKRASEPPWHRRFLQEGGAEHIAHVRREIEARGALSSKDFASPRAGLSGWWNWKPTKLALEYLFARGELMTSHRVHFRRYYDLSERVLARHRLTLDKSIADFRHFAIRNGLRALGVGTVAQVADYYRQSKRIAAATLDDMQRAGTVLPVAVAGWREGAYIHREDLALLERAQAGQLEPHRTVFLSPFDNLFWDRARDEMLWDFRYRIEVYTPKAKRVYGYYVMPILHGQELVGRIDPKIERKQKRLVLQNLHMERGQKLRASLTRGIIQALEEFMRFHGCDSVELRQCNRAPLQRRLRRHFG